MPGQYKDPVKNRLELVTRFWSRVAQSEGCWLFKGALNKKGYGEFPFRGKVKKAHRVAFELSVGPIPEGLHVLHKCDTPACARPDHLFLGTNRDNVDDKVAKGRLLIGERAVNAKLSCDDVIEIRRAYAAKEAAYLDLGERFGVSKYTIRGVVRRESWKHLP